MALCNVNVKYMLHISNICGMLAYNNVINVLYTRKACMSVFAYMSCVI